MEKIHANDVHLVDNRKEKTIQIIYQNGEHFYDIDGNIFLTKDKKVIKLWQHIEIEGQGRRQKIFGFLQLGTPSFKFPQGVVRYFEFGAIVNPSAMIQFNAWPIKEITNTHYTPKNLKKAEKKLTESYQSQNQKEK